METKESLFATEDKSRAGALNAQAMVWALSALTQFHRLPFDPALVMGQMAPPYDLDALA